jgi:hypothetical protein
VTARPLSGRSTNMRLAGRSSEIARKYEENRKKIGGVRNATSSCDFIYSTWVIRFRKVLGSQRNIIKAATCGPALRPEDSGLFRSESRSNVCDARRASRRHRRGSSWWHQGRCRRCCNLRQSQASVAPLRLNQRNDRSELRANHS